MKKPKSIFKEEDVLASAKGANKEQRDLAGRAVVKAWEEACKILEIDFLNALYGYREEDWPTEHYWVGGEVGGVLHFNDYFVSTNVMADYFKYGYTPDQFFDWYWQSFADKDPKICMRDFIKLEKPPKV